MVSGLAKCTPVTLVRIVVQKMDGWIANAMTLHCVVTVLVVINVTCNKNVWTNMIGHLHLWKKTQMNVCNVHC